jgi:hypothetical protein
MASLNGVWIPEDVLNAIFEATAPKNLKSALPLPHLSPLLLGHVCRVWRNLSHKNPFLWSRVYLSETREVSRWAKRQRHAADLDLGRLKCTAQAHYWLDRCGATGLSLALKAYPEEIAQAFFDTVVKENLGRFRELDLAGLPFQSVEVIHSDVPLPSLESLAISGVEAQVGLPPHTFDGWTGLARSSSLRRVHFGATHRYWKSVPLNVPWGQLTHLSLTSWLYGDVSYHLLKACTRLRSCTLSIQDVNWPKEEWSSVSLPHLRQLDVMFGWGALISVFDCLDMPSLRSFALRADSGARHLIRNLRDPSPSRDHLFAQLRNISTLTISVGQLLQREHDKVITSDFLFELLRNSCWHLTTLSISCQLENYGQLFARLCDEGNPLLPHLQFLTLCITHNLDDKVKDHFSPLAFVRMALVRSGRAQVSHTMGSSRCPPLDITIHVYPEWNGQVVGKRAILEAYTTVTADEPSVSPPFWIVEDALCCGYEDRPLSTVVGHNR